MMRRINIKELFQNRKTLYFALCIILISVLSLTIVYAALSVTLNITGSTEVTASNWNIHLANPEVKSGSVNSNVPTISGNNLSFSVNLATPGDYYEFTVDVVNGGSIDAMIDSVVKTPELTSEQAKYIKYEITYENGESINTNQTIKSGTSTPIKVRVEYRKDISASDLPSTATELSLKLTLIYVQSDGTGSEITNNGAVESLVTVVSGDGTQVGNEVCIKNECFYVISSTDSTVTMLSKYNLYVGGEKDGSSWTAYGDEATGKQDSTMLGYVSGQSIKNGTTVFSSDTQKGTNYSDYSGSIVERYVNNYKTILESDYGVDVVEARLITKDELTSDEIGCSDTDYTCTGSAYPWIYSTSYWSGSADYTSFVWLVDSNGDIYSGNYYEDNVFGVRPVIIISKSNF